MSVFLIILRKYFWLKIKSKRKYYISNDFIKCIFLKYCHVYIIKHISIQRYTMQILCKIISTCLLRCLLGGVAFKTIKRRDVNLVSLFTL